MTSLIETERDKFKEFDRWFLRCPFDQKEHLIKPETTVDDFPKNFVLIDLLKNKG